MDGATWLSYGLNNLRTARLLFVEIFQRFSTSELRHLSYCAAAASAVKRNIESRKFEKNLIKKTISEVKTKLDDQICHKIFLKIINARF